VKLELNRPDNWQHRSLSGFADCLLLDRSGLLVGELEQVHGTHFPLLNLTSSL